ncbi:MAG: deoxyribodipyrimidine photo-lyase [Acidimicrobiales bacterium]
MTGGAPPAPTVVWFRRDLRTTDQPALLAAVEDATGGPVAPLFVVDDALLASSGANHRVFNPAVQASRCHPEGAYVDRYVPEAGGPDYPPPLVDHAEERLEALRRWDEATLSLADRGHSGAGR